MNGLEVVFHLGKDGQPAGNILPPPTEFWKNIPQKMDMAIFLRRMRRRATIVFYRAYYQHLLKSRYGQISVAHSH
jgi:hypothetical protein